MYVLVAIVMCFALPAAPLCEPHFPSDPQTFDTSEECVAKGMVDSQFLAIKAISRFGPGVPWRAEIICANPEPGEDA